MTLKSGMGQGYLMGKRGTAIVVGGLQSVYLGLSLSWEPNMLNDVRDLRLQTSLGLTVGLTPMGPAAEHHGPRKEGWLIWCPSVSLLWDAGVGRLFTASLFSTAVRAQPRPSPRTGHRPAGLLCQQLVWDGADPLGSALEQTPRKAGQ